MIYTAVLPGGFQMWQFKKIIGRGKYVAVSGNVAVENKATL
jgi:hypothetical protein